MSTATEIFTISITFSDPVTDLRSVIDNIAAALQRQLANDFLAPQDETAVTHAITITHIGPAPYTVPLQRHINLQMLDAPNSPQTL